MSRGLKMLNMALGQNLTKENIFKLGKKNPILNCKIQHDGSLTISDNMEQEHKEKLESLDIPIVFAVENESVENCWPEALEHVSAENQMVFAFEIESQPNQRQVISSISERIQLTPEKPKSKRCNVNKNEWKVKRNAKRREKGQPYKSKQKTNTGWTYELVKPAKTIKPRCNCSLSKKGTSSIIKCNNITEEDRLAIFNRFWALTWNEKTIFVKGLAQVVDKQRIRLRNNNNDGLSRRTNSITYSLRKVNNTTHRVCKNMFVNTLSIGQGTIFNWLIEKAETKDRQVISETSEPTRTTFQTKSKIVKATLTEFFESLSKMESHYCRKSTSKLYLEPEWKSITRLYAEYKSNWCFEKNVAPLSITTFSNVFERMNLSLFQPKKDQCDICVGHQTKNIEDAVYEQHQLKKHLARAEKLKDKESSLQFVFTMDLQSVLLCPKSNVSSLYYKTKLMVHNFTIYNLKTHDGYCFIWHEAEGGVGSNEFSSILSHFILCEVVPNLKNSAEEVIFYSDGCTSQNRNSILSNALVNIAMTTNVVLVQKILEKGHTQMEVDSMHSVIERQIKNRTINIPADYVDICRQARLQPKPYIVKYLNYSFFKNFNTVKFYNSIRPGKVVGDSTVNQIRAIKYYPDGKIQLKLGFTDEWFDLPQRYNQKIKSISFNNLPALYNSRLPIKKVKFDHLQSLKSTMPHDYHSFYDGLPFI